MGIVVKNSPVGIKKQTELYYDKWFDMLKLKKDTLQNL